MRRLKSIRNHFAPLARRLALGWAVAGCASTVAQQPNMHYFHHSNMPPGMVGQQQLLRGPGMAGYAQAVEILVPDKVKVALSIEGEFDSARPGPVLAGMQIGYVYSIQLTNIPFHEGAELYPTVELINRLNPPPGVRQRFPVPLEFTTEEIEMALDGRFVTRVIYLEDPESALQQRDDPRHQRFVDVGPREDPLYIADRLGRPMAILRMGSRVPDSNELAGKVNSPPIELYESVTSQPETIDLKRAAQAVERQDKDIPRIPLGPPPVSRPPMYYFPQKR